MNRRLRTKLLVQAFLALACLHETVGCPQLLGNAIKTGTRSFLDGSLTSTLLCGFNPEFCGF